MDQQKFDPARHLTKVKGQDYLEVKYRIEWFRQDWPDGMIETNLETAQGNVVVFKAAIQTGSGALATGWGTCRMDEFSAPFEKAETKAIGRALAALGYGTQFAIEIDEGEALADTPVVPRQQQAQTYQPPHNPHIDGGRGAEEEVQQQYQQQRQPQGDRSRPTQGQKDFARDLLDKKVPVHEHDSIIAHHGQGATDLDDLSRSEISALIDQLKPYPFLKTTR